MNAAEWVKKCEAAGNNPLYEAVACGVCAALGGDRASMREWKALVKQMRKRGYHEAAKAEGGE